MNPLPGPEARTQAADLSVAGESGGATRGSPPTARERQAVADESVAWA